MKIGLKLMILNFLVSLINTKLFDFLKVEIRFVFLMGVMLRGVLLDICEKFTLIFEFS